MATCQSIRNLTTFTCLPPEGSTSTNPQTLWMIIAKDVVRRRARMWARAVKARLRTTAVIASLKKIIKRRC